MIETRLLHSQIFRFSLVYILSFSTAVMALFGFVIWSTTQSVTHQIDATVDAEITALAEQFRQRGIVGLIQAIERRAEGADDRRGLYLLTDARFSPLAGNLSRWPQSEPDPSGWVTFPLTEKADPEARNAGRARLFRLGGRYHLLVGHDVRIRLELSELIRHTLYLGLGLTLALAILGALVMSRLLLGKIEAISATSREIMAGDLSRRIPVSRRNDEFDRLAVNLNAMLDQIQRLMDGLRQVSDNIAHDLRSPLTRLRSRLEITLLDHADEAAYREAIERTISEADELLTTFNSLLSIARAEAGERPETLERIDLSALVEDARELYEPLAEARDLSLEGTSQATPSAVIDGDRNLVFQALANLLDNAIKFAPEGSTVALGLTADNQTALVTVTDRGPGIPEKERDKVISRFYRGEASRSTPGSGLGLSLVAAVARQHGATLAFADNAPGLRATLTFPLKTKRKEPRRPPGSPPSPG